MKQPCNLYTGFYRWSALRFCPACLYLITYRYKQRKKRKIRHHAKQLKVYVILLASGSNQLEICHSLLLEQPYYHKKQPEYSEQENPYSEINIGWIPNPDINQMKQPCNLYTGFYRWRASCWNSLITIRKKIHPILSVLQEIMKKRSH